MVQKSANCPPTGPPIYMMLDWFSFSAIVPLDTTTPNGNSCVTFVHKSYPSNDDAIIAGKSRGVSGYHAVPVATLPPGAAKHFG